MSAIADPGVWRGELLNLWRGAKFRDHLPVYASGAFLRKAIGWALRQYAWTDAAGVVRYVSAKNGELSPLSRKEAMKNVRD